MYQDIYSFKTSQEATDFPALLMHTATFANSPSDFTKTEAENLDEAYNSIWNLLFGKENTVFFITYADFSFDQSHLSSLWKGIAEKESFLLSQYGYLKETLSVVCSK